MSHRNLLNSAKAFALISLLSLTLIGCGQLLDIDVIFAGEKTTLEKQVLGAYSEMGENLLIYSSVRGVDEDGSIKTPPESTDSQKAAYSAMKNREYNADDIQAILSAGIVGEGASGLLLRPEESDAPNVIKGLTVEETARLISEENADREAIMTRLALAAPEATPAEIAWIFAQLNQESAPAGAWIQSRDGNWGTK